MSDQDAANPIPPCFDCKGHATERLIDMFVRMTQEKRIRLGQKPAERSVFRKLHGVAYGRFEVCPDIDPELSAGILAQDKLDAWIRFSSDTNPASRDLGSTLGIAIKLFGVPDSDGLGEEGETADILMQNFPCFFVQNAKDMCEFTYAGVVQGDYDSYFASHPDTKRVIDAMGNKTEGSVLTATYWAILPFHLGEEIVKYQLEPETEPQNVPNDSRNYLAVDMANRLAQDEYRFRFMIQRRTNPDTMPLDQAMVDWPVSESPFVHVATLVLPRQNILERGQSDYGQGLAFNIWRTPQANAPCDESSIAVVRRAVYQAGATARKMANGQSLQDPTEPRPSPVAATKPHDGCIVKAVIYPSIGVARVGNSPEEFFVGPEVTEPPAEAGGFYRDDQGRLKRQAARFRVYGVDADGHIIKELSTSDSGADVRWSVALANKKAAWYTFQLALDIPEAAMAPPTTLRNPGVADRTQLAITPSSQTVEGPDAPPKKFDDGSFMGTNVYLGEIFTDDQGRLLVLGGQGESKSHDGNIAITFANNEGWHDDVSDGPVTAEVTYNGASLDVVPAWVIVAPPNYGPRRKSVRTMWDLMRDVAINNGLLPAPVRPSYACDILPIFRRLAGLQWVNAGFAAGFGWKGLIDFTDESLLERLGDNGPIAKEQRQVVANHFRHFDVDSWSPAPWPWIYGDATNEPPAQTPRQHAALSDTQLAMLQQWADGDFDADYDPGDSPPESIDAVPLAEQGETLTRAALEFCVADAFHPGCEMTWVVRTPTMYLQAFRFKHRDPGSSEPALGQVLTPDVITLREGPFFGQLPGGLSRWMAVPWQTDTASCLSGYHKRYDPYLPAFWPARVPNQVLTYKNYTTVMDCSRPLDERLAAFANRAAWNDPLGTVSYTDQINNMIQGFDHLGVVEHRAGPTDVTNFPADFEVEDRRVLVTNAVNQQPRETIPGITPTYVPGTPVPAADVDYSQIEKLHRFPGIQRQT
jgi:L-Lysine epsilon oxidase N-terminal/L-lysine epsilon oxidase C-terminal domain